MKMLSALASRKDIELGPRPGQRIRSGVVAPVTSSKRKSLDTDGDMDDMEFEAEMASFGKPALLEKEEMKMIDLDSGSE